MIPPKHFDIFPFDWGIVCPEGLDAFRFFLNNNIKLGVGIKALGGIKRFSNSNVVTLGQHYTTGDEPIVMLYIYIINRHAGTPDKKTYKTI